jgi:hypothetical protein
MNSIADLYNIACSFVSGLQISANEKGRQATPQGGNSGGAHEDKTGESN